MKSIEMKFNLDDPDILVKMFRFARDDLASMRSRTGRPKLLEWQLRLYDHCLDAPNAKELIEKYMEAKRGVDRINQLQNCAKAVGFAEPFPGDA